jgi:hypothetical protein
VPSERSPTDGQPRRPGWRGWLRRHRLALLVALAGLVAAMFWLGPGGDAAPGVQQAASATGARGFFDRVDAAPQAPILPAVRVRRQQQLMENFKLADHTYCSYREGSKYPPGSRPMAQNADQAYPNRAVMETNPMRLERGGADARVQLQTSQSRVYMAAGESVAFQLRALDAEGKVLPLVVTRALAQGMTFRSERPAPRLALAFADDGAGADQAAGDGIFSAVLAPAQTGLAGFHGAIRTEVRYSVNGQAGVVLFDVVYSPELPASWTGQVREGFENGALSFHLQASVRLPGRYIVTGRVDDARGRPFALLTFNDLLGAGAVDVPLTVVGKLVQDGEPQLPLVLRDVDGYLLKEDADPDRVLMPRLEGPVATSKNYPLKSFSNAEWQSEERSRYLTEFAKDLQLARGALAEFDPAQPLPESACEPAAINPPGAAPPGVAPALPGR